MKAFKDHDFEGHAEVQHRVLDYLGRNAALKQAIKDLKTQMAEVLSSLSSVSALAKQAKASADKALSAGGGGGIGAKVVHQHSLVRDVVPSQLERRPDWSSSSSPRS